MKRHRTCLHVPTTVRRRPERLESCEGEADVSPGPVESSLPFPFSLGGKEESSTIHTRGEREHRWQRGICVVLQAMAGQGEQ